MLKLTTDCGDGTAPEISQTLDELACEGARRMIAEALKLDVDEYVAELQHLHDEKGHTLVVRNGKARPRTVTLGVGPVEIEALRVNDRRAGHRILAADASRLCSLRK